MLIPESQWPALRERANLPTFCAATSRLRQDVRTYLDRPVEIPSERAGYYHDYFCPDHGVQLLFDPSAPAEHRCPVDGALHRGARYDAAWRWSANNLLSESALRLAQLWRLNGSSRHHEEAAHILKGYAARYPHHLAAERAGNHPGVATFTTLDEAVWIMPIAWAFDIIRAELPGEEDDAIASQLLAPAAEFLVDHHRGDIHNFSCWHNAAIGTIGLVLDRDDLVDTAIHGTFGFDAQLRDGVLSDGLWYEGSFSYHFYALAGLLALAKATASRPDLDLRDRPSLKAMLDAPIRCAYPDGSLPATNDCWYFTSLVGECCHGVPPAAAFYEPGYAWYDDPVFAQVLHRAYRHGPRDSLDALLYGAESIPSADPGPLPSVHLPACGYAILRAPSPVSPESGPSSGREGDGAEQRYVLLKHGPHGGGHGHPDKLSLILHACGERLSPDLGTPGYGLDLFETWYRQTLSHNTVAIDGMSQPPATGRLECFQGEGPFQVADASVAWETGPYEGVTMRRVVLARPDYYLDVFLVRCGRPREMDWIYRNAGACDVSLEVGPLGAPLGESEGYEHISGAEVGEADEDFEITWRLNDAGLKLYSAGAPGTQVIVGTVPANPSSERHPILIVRRRARAAAFISVFHPYASSPRITSVDWYGRLLLDEGWAGCLVQLSDKREGWTIRLAPDTDVTVPPGPVDEQFEYCLG